MTAILFLTVCTALYYLASRAKITAPLWTRYPEPIAYWTDCAACSGLWYGLGCGLVGKFYLNTLPAFLGLEVTSWWAVGAAGLFGMVWTPVAAFAMAYSWTALSGVDASGDDS